MPTALKKFDLPQLLGPTNAFIPPDRASSVFSEKER
jgi:hypothetical protein